MHFNRVAFRVGAGRWHIRKSKLNGKPESKPEGKLNGKSDSKLDSKLEGKPNGKQESKLLIPNNKLLLAENNLKYDSNSERQPYADYYWLP